MNPMTEEFGSLVFNHKVMRARLPKETYKALQKTISENTHLEREVANVVANAMKDWALEKGATHFTHWFQPMTGITAEKHDSFLAFDGSGGAIAEFAGKELVRGEPDASSFPSGGLRATFEARGYTAWDPSSFAFIKDETLCIPTAFCSYGGQVLDKKTPLLKSMQALDKQAVRVLRALGDTETRHVVTTIGPEQEYFLITKEMADKRPDLRYCGRTLLGARPPKGQEFEDHYFGTIKPAVKAFMKDLDEHLWKLGVLAKTEHNEVAPGQHELAPVFTTTNIGADHNQITMELMKQIAAKHGLACLLHEKPFAGVNGSGKHNNWSIATDKGENLLEPGKTPSQNLRFLLFLTAVIKAVDEYQALLRLSVATAGNDHRLGASEAPPAIVSVFVGEELTAILKSLEKSRAYHDKERTQMETGAAVLPHFLKDTTDRNRTSPFAFTGNKFEFRMPGSSLSISGPNITLNTIAADALSDFADALEGHAGDVEAFAWAYLRDVIRSHKRILFQGNNYTAEWEAEAARRGLLNLRTTVEALPYFVDEKSIRLFTRHGVLTEEEIRSRYEILMDSYVKTLHMEALTLLDMAKKEVLPAVLSYEKELLELLGQKQALYPQMNSTPEGELLEKVCSLAACLYQKIQLVEQDVVTCRTFSDVTEQGRYYGDNLTVHMLALRSAADELEMLFPKEKWPYPSYGEMLFSVS